MERQRDLTHAQAWRAIGQLEGGRRQQAVAEFFAVSQSVISRLWNRFLATGDVQRRRGQGRPASTTPRDDRYLTLFARRNRNHNATLLRSELAAATGRVVSTQTIRNRLHNVGMYARRPLVCVPLTALHKRARRIWAEQHINWNHDDWAQVLFCDESRFALNPDNRRILIWREPGTRNQPQFVRERPPYEGGSVMVWAGISAGGHTDLYVIQNGNLTAQRYLDEILRPIVLPYAGAMGERFILMDDNARPHRANIVNNWIEQLGINRMDWPANSPDGNPTEHAWDALGRRVAARNMPPRTIQELQIALIEEWNNIPQEFFDVLIQSMPMRCQTFIAVRGDHTHY